MGEEESNFTLFQVHGAVAACDEETQRRVGWKGVRMKRPPSKDSGIGGSRIHSTPFEPLDLESRVIQFASSDSTSFCNISSTTRQGTAPDCATASLTSMGREVLDVSGT